MAKAKKTGQPARAKLIVSCLLLGLAAWAVVPRALTVHDLGQRKAVLEQRKAALLEKNQQLTLEKNSLNSPETIERIARERLGMLKNGERYIVTKQGDN
ncbi:MAG: septum formation initiator family protein [Syntrophomonas sp.]